MKYLVRISFAVAVSLLLAGLMTASTTPAISDQDAHDATALALRQMKFNSEVYRNADDRVPGETLPELVATLQSLGGDFSAETERLLNAGLDGWGRELVLEKRSESTWMLRSRGPNGVDDQGKGDDIEVDLHLTPRGEPGGGESGSCNCGSDEEEAQDRSPAIDPTQQPTPANRDA